jgi:cytoskeletal protein CcmA (bactofilin family)
MSIFRRENEPPRAPAAPPREPAPAGERRGPATLIAPGTLVTGRVGGATEVVVEGEVEGDLEVDGVVTVGREGKVRGDIVARVVKVGGRLVGNARGGELVEVLASGTLEGDVAAPRVTIAEGAYFKGRVEMGAGRAATPGAGPAAPPAPES